MAKLSAHGAEIGRIEYASHRKAYMADGKILKDSGHGWKLWGKLRPGVTPESAFANAKSKLAEKMANNPALAAYCDHIKSLAPLSKRWKLILAIQMMPDDPDGIWSDCCDSYSDNIDADLDEIVTLCRLRAAAGREANVSKEMSAETLGA